MAWTSCPAMSCCTSSISTNARRPKACGTWWNAVLYKLSFSAFSLEVAALLLLLRQSQSATVLLAFLLLHGGASVLIALATRLLLPRRYAQPRLWVLAFLF